MNTKKDSERSGRKTNTSDDSNEPTVKPVDPESFRDYCVEKFDGDTGDDNIEDQTDATGKILFFKIIQLYSHVMLFLCFSTFR